MMDRGDLDAIQSKLKLAIKNHQMLVVKMKSEPQNTTMKTKLHELQTEIMSLSDKQKTIVQNLRKELVYKQRLNLPLQPQTVSAKVQLKIQTHPQTAPTLTALSVGQQHMVACSNALQTQTVILPTTFSVTVPTPHSKLQTCQTVVLPVASVNQTAKVDISRVSPINNNKIVVKSSNQQPIKPALKPLAPRGVSPPIRVPHYPVIQRQQSLPNNKCAPTTNKSTMLPPSVSVQRRLSETDVSRLHRKGGGDKKPIQPAIKQKMDFMAALDLVTPDALKELQSKRTERKRRSTANPQFSYNFEPERKRVSHYLLKPLPPGMKRPRGRPPKHPVNNGSRPHTPSTPESPSHMSKNLMRNCMDEAEMHDDFCAICGKDEELLMCSTCNMVYHLDCLTPPLTVVPTGAWSCSKCMSGSKNLASTPETLALLHSYMATKAAKEEEKRKLKKKSDDLTNEKLELETKSKQLNNSFNMQVEKNQHLLVTTSETQLTIEKLKNFIKVVQAP